VAVTFQSVAGNGQSTGNATIGGVLQGAVTATYDAANQNVLESQIVSNASSANEFAPYLTAASIDCTNDQINYVFNQSVNTQNNAGVGAPSTAPVPADFKAELSNGQILSGTYQVPSSSTNSNVISIRFTSANEGPAAGGGTPPSSTSNLNLQCEHGVVAAATAGAVSSYVTGNSTPVGSVDSSAPIGDNAGAFADGFTTAPDVFGISITKGQATGANDTLTIRLDDRLNNSYSGTPTNNAFAGYGSPAGGGSTGGLNTGQFTYLDSSGNPVTLTGAGATPTCTAPNTMAGGTAMAVGTAGQQQPPGPETITCTYGVGSLNSVAAVQFNFGAFTGVLTSPGTMANSTPGTDAFSLPQIDAPLSSSAIVKAYKSNIAKINAKKHKTHRSKKH
jgi:hypothetical protein